MMRIKMKNPLLDQTGGPREDEQEKSQSQPVLQKSTEWSKSHQKTTSESSPAEDPMQTTQDLEEPAHLEFETGAANDQP
nr:hypothetical protein [Tanacetum cinerariifolium]